MLDLVEELVGEAQRVLHAHRVADALDEAVPAALGAAAQLLVVGLGRVDVLRGADAVGEGGDGGDRALAQHQVVVDELLEGAQVDRVLVLVGHVQAQQVHVERAGLGQVGDHDLHVGAAQDVRGGNGGLGDGVAHGSLLGRRCCFWVRRRGPGRGESAPGAVWEGTGPAGRSRTAGRSRFERRGRVRRRRFPAGLDAELGGVHVAEGDVHGLLVGVEVDRAVAALVAEAGGLHAAERGAQVAHVVGVQPHHAGLDRLREVVRALEVVGPHVGGQPVLGVVRQRQGLLVGVERGDCHDRAEDLLLEDPGVGGDVGEDGRGDVGALLLALGQVLRAAAAGHQAALGLADLHVGHDLVVVLRVHQGADLASWGRAGRRPRWSWRARRSAPRSCRRCRAGPGCGIRRCSARR